MAAFKYLAPYIFRVALSNRRLHKLAGDQVTFSYRDSGSGDLRFRTLGTEEFIRRFLQHVLPKGFVKVRYYGIFSPGKRRLLERSGGCWEGSTQRHYPGSRQRGIGVN